MRSRRTSARKLPGRSCNRPALHPASHSRFAQPAGRSRCTATLVGVHPPARTVGFGLPSSFPFLRDTRPMTFQSICSLGRGAVALRGAARRRAAHLDPAARQRPRRAAGGRRSPRARPGPRGVCRAGQRPSRRLADCSQEAARARSRNCRPTRSPRATTSSGSPATGPGTTTERLPLGQRLLARRRRPAGSGSPATGSRPTAAGSGCPASGPRAGEAAEVDVPARAAAAAGRRPVDAGPGRRPRLRRPAAGSTARPLRLAARLLGRPGPTGSGCRPTTSGRPAATSSSTATGTTRWRSRGLLFAPVYVDRPASVPRRLRLPRRATWSAGLPGRRRCSCGPACGTTTSATTSSRAIALTTLRTTRSAAAATIRSTLRAVMNTRRTELVGLDLARLRPDVQRRSPPPGAHAGAADQHYQRHKRDERDQHQQREQCQQHQQREERQQRVDAFDAEAVAEQGRGGDEAGPGRGSQANRESAKEMVSASKQRATLEQTERTHGVPTTAPRTVKMEVPRTQSAAAAPVLRLLRYGWSCYTIPTIKP